MAMCEQPRPRIGAIICNTRLDEDTLCQGVCVAYNSRDRVTYYKCTRCQATKKVTRPKAG